MNVPFETQPVPRVPTIEAAGELMVETVAGRTPAFVIEERVLGNQDLCGFPEAFDQLMVDNRLKLIKDTSYFFVDVASRLRYGESGQYLGYTRGQDAPLHIDGKWEDAVDLAVFGSESGRAEASFFRTRTPDARYSLGFDSTDLFFEGQVDDDYLEPVRYITEVGRDDTLIFRRGGHAALAHLFRTTQAPRQSQRVRIGRPYN